MPLFQKGSASRTAIFGSLITIFVTAILLLALESFMRIRSTHIVEQSGQPKHGILESHPELLVQFTSAGKRLTPNSHVVIRNHGVSKRDIKVDVNSLGFRDEEIPAVKKNDEIRILVIGDSITEGDYLQANETYVRQAQQFLREINKTHFFRLINAGIGDAGTKEEVDLLMERGLSIHPDIVVLAFYLNDSRPPWGFPQELGSRGWLRRHSVLAETIYRELKLWKWVQETGQNRNQWISALKNLRWQKDRKAFDQLIRMANLDWGAAWNNESWKAVDPELQKLKMISERNSFKVIILAFPVAFQVHADFLEDKPQRALKQKAKDLNFYFLDLLPLLRTHRTQRFYYDQCHANPEANRWIGQALAQFLGRVVP